MTTVRLFSDPHLGVSRQAHTTAESSRRLNGALYATAMKCADSGDTCTRNYLGGDLFDKTHNLENILLQGLKVAEQCIVLSGNHDETNRADSKSSLDVVAETDTMVVRSRVGEVKVTHQSENGMWMVSHHSTQELFIEALNVAYSGAASEGGRNFLMVHCNRGELPGPASDSTLVIPDETEDELLEVFDKIFYGHIHNPGLYKNGRVVVMGNTHPTSFSDISDKFCYDLDTQTGELTRHLIWDKSCGYASVELGTPIKGAPMFIDVTGSGTRKEAMDYIADLWKELPDAFAIRSKVQYKEEGQVEFETVDFSDLPSVVRKDLEGSDLLPVFEELVGDEA